MNVVLASQLPTLNHFSMSVLVLIIIVLSKILATRLYPHIPLRIFAFYCEKLAEKVNKPKNSQYQQSIAGLIALVITLAPLISMLWLFEWVMEWRWVFDGLLLYLALGPFGLGKTNHEIAKALFSNKNYNAKQLLTPWVLRETSQLSSLGLSKASIEMFLIRSQQQNINVCFYYLLLGPLFALTYRFILEMHYCWNIKKTRFKYFGSHINTLVQYLQWLPVRIFTLLMFITLLGHNLSLYWQLLKGKFFQLNNNFTLHCLALALGIQLGGVAVYDGIKVRKPHFNDQAKQPEPKDIIYATKFITRTNTLLIVILLLCALIFHKL